MEEICDQLKVPYSMRRLSSRKNALSVDKKSRRDRSANAARTPSERCKVQLIWLNI